MLPHCGSRTPLPTLKPGLTVKAPRLCTGSRYGSTGFGLSPNRLTRIELAHPLCCYYTTNHPLHVDFIDFSALLYNKIRGLNLGLCLQSEPSDYRKVFCCSDPEATGASPVFGTHRGIARMPTCDRAFAHPPVTALLQSFFTRSTHSPYSAVVYMSKFSS